MFLKTQEDINKLFSRYPLENHLIEIQEGERVNFTSGREHGSLRINHINEFRIETHPNEVFLFQKNMTEYLEGIEYDNFPDFKYKYSVEGIKIVSIIKKLSHTENSIIENIPIYINNYLIPQDKITSVVDLYIMIDKFSRFIQEKRRQLLLFQNTHFDYREQNNSDFISYHNYYFQSFAVYFGILIRNSLDDGDRVSLRRILSKGKKCGIISEALFEKYNNQMNTFTQVLEELNNRITHLDGDTFLDSIQITRTSQTTTEFSISQINPAFISSNIKNIFNLVHTVLYEGFGVLIWNSEDNPYPNTFNLNFTKNN